MANVRRISHLAGLLLALPLVVLAACDSGGSSGTGPFKGGGNTTPGTGTNGAAASALTGVWGMRAMNNPNQGEVWEFYADGTFQLNAWVLQDGTLYREITVNGTYTAANGTLTITGSASTCSDAKRGPFSFNYTVNATSFVISGQGGSFTYTKNDAPNPNAQAQVLGCFDAMTMTFTAGQVMNIGL